MPVAALFALSLIAATDQAGQSPPATACPAEAGRQGEPVCPAPSQPIPIPYPTRGLVTQPTVRPGIRASNGDEAGTAHRVTPPDNPPPPTQRSGPTGRPVGQPAAAGLGAQVQREAAPAASPSGTSGAATPNPRSDD